LNSPPEHLSPSASALWSAVTARHTLPPQHERLLQLACEALDRYQQARETIAEQGLVTENRYGATVAHPAVSIERDARLAFARLLRDMHLNEWPTSVQKDEFDRFLEDLRG
jgi:P27 family predicted phage terminase small subunit